MIGKTIAHYRVGEKIGAGGMGEVYRATDTKLNREVALKVLPEGFAKDAERMARFKREAQVLASLNHPNIAAIYGLEQEGDTQAIAMELVEGPTLSERIKEGALPLEEALNIAKQISEALESAHEQGVIHRDLKPANVKARKDVQVKVLDFGLAKALEAPMTESEIAHSPTLSIAATKAGIILGTAAYMSPEQARGEEADKRADIWSFGVVLFEMLTGQRLFTGRTASDVLAHVLTKEPDWDKLPETVPHPIRKLLRRCLTRERKQRLHAIADARLEIEEALTGTADMDAATVTGKVQLTSYWRAPLTWVFVSVIGLLAVLLVWNPWGNKAPSQPSSKLSINLPAEAPSAPPGTMPLGVGRRSLAISIEGSRLVYVALAGGRRQLYVREMSSGEIKPIPGTEGAYGPFFSPDGEWVGFFAEGKLKKVALSGGTPIVLADAPLGLGGSWAPDGSIYFVPDEGAGLVGVSATGREVKSVIKRAASSYNLANPQVLPGGKAILFNASGSGVGIYSINSGEQRILIPSGFGARYIPTGHLLYTQPGKLLAVPFDKEKLDVTGPAVTVLEGIQTTGYGGAEYEISQDGLLAYIPGGHTQAGNFVWLDRKGNKEPLGLPPGLFSGFALSPDGKTAAIPIFDEGKVDIWLYDSSRDIPTRFTFDGLSDDPSWTPDGKKLVFTSWRDGVGNIFAKPVAGSEEALQLTKYEAHTGKGRMSGEGHPLPIIVTSTETSSNDVYLLSLDGKESSGTSATEPIPFLKTPFQEQFANISPDGRWIAYYSNETGGWEIYVQPLEETGEQSAGTGRVRISTGGGEEPIWSRDGRELFYRWGKKIYVVDVTLGPEFRAGVPRVLFDGPFVNLPGWSYDVSPDGKRFLLVENEELEKANTELIVIINFFDHVRRLTPSGDN